MEIFTIGFFSLMVLNTALGLYILKQRNKIIVLEHEIRELKKD